MEDKKARDWARILTEYRRPCTYRSSLEIAATVAPFVGLWAAAWWMLSYSTVLAVLIACMNAFFLVRLFCIQHDCGHGTLFKNKAINDWIGRILGMFTLTPYEVWRRAHSIHHGASGNLTKRGIGDSWISILPTSPTDRWPMNIGCGCGPIRPTGQRGRRIRP